MLPNERVSIFFPAGDFEEALRRFEQGEQQVYATHDEVSQLLLDLVAAQFDVHVFSFVTSEQRRRQVRPGLTMHDLGAKRFDDPRIVAAFEENKPTAAVIHFPHKKLLQAASRSKGRVFPVLASSYNRNGPRAALERWGVKRILNHPKFRFVSNHCRPASEHLAGFGVQRSKLIPWNVPMPHTPQESAAKSAPQREERRLVYAGAINEAKGVGDILEAVALLDRGGLTVHCSLAGGGEIEKLQARARELGIGHLVTFLGVIPNDQVITLFRSGDAVVVPSRRVFTEGFPLALMEAIASRTPVICSDHPMFVPVMRDGETALVFAESRPEELAAKVRQLFSDDALYEKLSRNAEVSWGELQRTADWRTMLRSWFVEGDESYYLARHVLDADGSTALAGQAV